MDYYNTIVNRLMKQYPRETYGGQLDYTGRQMLGNKWGGVYPSDAIPPPQIEKPYIIVNLDKRNEPGSHWVAIAYDKGTNYVYDSFGRKTTKILPALKQRGGFIKEADRDPEQSVDEDNCGQRCLAWLKVFNDLGKRAALKI